MCLCVFLFLDSCASRCGFKLKWVLLPRQPLGHPEQHWVLLVHDRGGALLSMNFEACAYGERRFHGGFEAGLKLMQACWLSAVPSISWE